jgi:hypothetical protein
MKATTEVSQEKTVDGYVEYYVSSIKVKIKVNVYDI